MHDTLCLISSTKKTKQNNRTKKIKHVFLTLRSGTTWDLLVAIAISWPQEEGKTLLRYWEVVPELDNSER
jgi:hypothetical protein